MEFICKVLSLKEEFSPNYCGNFFDEGLFWRSDGKYAPITFLVICSDLFDWGSADAEPLTEENFHELITARNDICDKLKLFHTLEHPCDEKYYKGIDRWFEATNFIGMLFTARIRKMRPQKPVYEYIPKELHSLFDACGEPRTSSEHYLKS